MTNSILGRFFGPKRQHESFEIAVSVLGFKQNDGWVAVALEMDIWGHGATYAEALEDLEDLIKMQISYAMSRRNPEMMWKPAEATYWNLYASVKARRLNELMMEPEATGYQIAGIPIPSPHVLASRRSDFNMTDG